jgi:hypothetical protein
MILSFIFIRVCLYCTGHDCSQEAKQGYWEVISPNLESTIPPGTASHASVIYNNSLWVFGGNNLTLDPRGPIPINRYEFDGIKTFFSHVQVAEILNSDLIWSLSIFAGEVWEIINTKGDIYPPSLYGHTCVVFEVWCYVALEKLEHGYIGLKWIR